MIHALSLLGDSLERQVEAGLMEQRWEPGIPDHKETHLYLFLFFSHENFWFTYTKGNLWESHEFFSGKVFLSLQRTLNLLVAPSCVLYICYAAAFSQWAWKVNTMSLFRARQKWKPQREGRSAEERQGTKDGMMLCACMNRSQCVPLLCRTNAPIKIKMSNRGRGCGEGQGEGKEE